MINLAKKIISIVLNQINIEYSVINLEEMNEESKSLALGTKHILNNQFQNRIIYKCRQERNQFINREVNNMIKNQLKIFCATKKIQKQIQGAQKENIVFTSPQTAIEKVQRFRQEQSHKQWEKLKQFQIKDEEKSKKILSKLTEKQELNMSKSSENFLKYSKVQQRFKENLRRQLQKVDSLSNNDLIATPRSTSRMNSKGIVSDEIALRRAENLKKIHQSEESKFNKFIDRMKKIQEQRIKKQMQDETKRSQTAKKVPKFSVLQRSNVQQKIISNWSHNFEQRYGKFEKRRAQMQQQKQKQMFDKSLSRFTAQQQVFQRKNAIQQKIAQKRIQQATDKIKKINKIRNSFSMNKSAANFTHNAKKVEEDHQKQQHHVVMRKIYNIIQKLKRLPSSQKLKKHEINLLLKNLDPSCEQYKQISKYIIQGKQKFFQQKRKD